MAARRTWPRRRPTEGPPATPAPTWPSSRRRDGAAQAAAALPARLPDHDPVHRAAARRARCSAPSSARKFFHPFNLSLILQQVTIIGIVGIAQTLIILTAGIDLSVGAIMVLSSVVMGKLAVDRRACRCRSPSCSACSPASPAALINGVAGHPSAPAAVHRHARHLEHLRRPEPLVLAEPDHPRSRTSRPRRRSCSSWAPRSSSAARGSPTARS